MIKLLLDTRKFRPNVWPLLQNLRVSDPGVGHVTVDSTPPIPARPGPRSPSNCLIVTYALTAEWNVVHAALMDREMTINKQERDGKQIHAHRVLETFCLLNIHEKWKTSDPVFLTCEAAHTSNALKMTSTTLWDVSTFPPTTAAFWEGWRMEPGGMMTLIGARQPWIWKKKTAE